MRDVTGISLPAYFRLCRSNVNFRRLWLAQLISGTCGWFYSVAIYDLLLQLTGSAEAIAIAVVLQILPMFLAGPTAGTVNDRVSRRRVMIVTDVLRAVIVLGMLGIQTREQIWILYLLLALEVTSAAFFESGRSAVIPNIVPIGNIQTANAVTSTTWSVTVTAGAGLGGFAVSFLGRPSAFLINSISFLISAWFLLRMRFHEPHLEQYDNVRLRDLLGVDPIREGFRYIWPHWRLIAMLMLKFGLGILGARNVLVPVIGGTELAVKGQAALGMSILYMFQGVGSLIGPLAAGPLVGSREAKMRWAVFAGYLAAGICYILFSAAQSLALAGLCMMGAHAGGSVVWVFSTTLLHLNTADRFRGRVFAADLGLFMITASTAAYLCGWAIDSGLSARLAAFGVGAAMFAPSAAWGVSIRRLWSSENSSQHGEERQAAS